MKHFYQFVSCLTLVAACISCQKAQEAPGIERQDILLTKSQELMVSEGNDFAFNLFRNISSLAGSFVLAPFSLQRALGIVQNGADGETRTEILSVLGFDGFSVAEVNDYYKSLYSQLLVVDNKIDLSVADAMFLNSGILTGYSIKDTFKEVVEKNYNANVQTLDFSESEKVKNNINNWCSEQTHGAIPSILNQLDENIIAYVLNATSFSGRWALQFDKDIHQNRFTKSDSSVTNVDYMSLTGDFYINNEKELSILRLPYGNRAFEMVVLLPSVQADIHHFLSTFQVEDWTKAMNNTYSRKVKVTLPRFTVTSSFDLDSILCEMGMPTAFTDKADFSALCDRSPAWIQGVRQNVRLDVNQRGATAEAVTIVPITGYTSNNTLTFHANHTFMYVIREISTGVILFMGVYDGD